MAWMAVCPADGTPLEPAVIHFPGWGASIQWCTSCGGEFLPAGEVRRLVARSLHQDFDLALGTRRGSSRRRCPHCSGAMHSLASSGVVAEVCATCSGWWLDRGEFENLATEGDAPVSSRMGRRTLHHHAAAKRGKTRFQERGYRRGLEHGFVAGSLMRILVQLLRRA